MHQPLVELARQHHRNLAPIPTRVSPRITRIDGIRAVMFDVYGTLLVSGSGDVGTTGSALGRETAAGEAFRALGFTSPPPGPDVVSRLHAVIEEFHRQQRTRGVEFPEVDIVQVWRSVTSQLQRDGHLRDTVVDAEQLAVEYELRANPVSPMPGAAELLEQLRSRRLVLGIVSNAQFFTPIVWEACFDKTMSEMGLSADMQYFSYKHLQAKPGTYLYQLAADRLSLQGITPSEVLYIGNDMRNDIWPAANIGFRTALFAGDERSLRLRRDDPQVAHVEPDIVISQLLDLLTALDPS